MALVEIQTVDGVSHTFTDSNAEFDTTILQVTTAPGVVHTFPLVNVIRLIIEAG